VGPALIASIVAGASAPAATSSQESSQSTLSPQAVVGKGLYAARCASCHGPSLEGGRLAPALSGAAFQADWNGKPARALYSRIISTMPLSDPGSLPPGEVLDIALYVFAVNGASLGTQPIPDAATLNNIKVDMGHKGS
jgi:mono/diheme cytochrome c family protein